MKTAQEAAAMWLDSMHAARGNFTTGSRRRTAEEARAAYVRGEIEMDELEIDLGYLGTFRVRRVPRAGTT